VRAYIQTFIYTRITVYIYTIRQFIQHWCFFYSLLFFRGWFFIIRLCYIVPPDILVNESSSDLTMKEGDNTTLRCNAIGYPQPNVTWRREDYQPININQSSIFYLINIRSIWCNPFFFLNYRRCFGRIGFEFSQRSSPTDGCLSLYWYSINTK
jgi:hypothetical protein